MEPGRRLLRDDGHHGLTDADDVTFAREIVASPGVAVVPGSSFYSRPELGATKVRFAFEATGDLACRGGSAQLGAPPDDDGRPLACSIAPLIAMQAFQRYHGEVVTALRAIGDPHLEARFQRTAGPDWSTWASVSRIFAGG